MLCSGLSISNCREQRPAKKIPFWVHSEIILVKHFHKLKEVFNKKALRV